MTARLNYEEIGVDRVINLAVVGLGKMGLSHLSMARAHPVINLAAICDSSGYVLDVLNKYTKVPVFTSFDKMLAEMQLDAVIIATPTHLHAPMVRTALHRGLHVFCEKPFCLEGDQGLALADLADDRGLVTQVGYHNRFVASFREVKSLLDQGAVGRVTRVLAEAYGPVVLKPSSGGWRSRRAAGGGCLYDYAAHPIDLANWYLGAPIGAGGSVLSKVFSTEIDDEVSSTLYYPGDVSAQVSVSWSDESQRKMSTKLTIWGTQGKISVDRQDLDVYLRDGARIPPGYCAGWNVRYTTELTPPVWFYLRGEEYSAQIDSFVHRVVAGDLHGLNDFGSAIVTDRALALILADSQRGGAIASPASSGVSEPGTRRWRSRVSR
ncbi:MAG: Gfo/Idh/MocA family oxidoreductase [Actinomycetota bacterium]|nr:Gfo/Idh/MocA family oxidoreductase [Actinomycetota bacterium]